MSDTVRALPFTSVRIDESSFWGRRMSTNRNATLKTCFEKCESTGRLRNFAVAAGRAEGGFEGIYFNDSDVFKIIEGAAYVLGTTDDPELDAYLDRLIDDIAAAQEEDGYLYTARTINDPEYNYPGKEGRWTRLAHGHELYNVGHMYEAAVAYHAATGKRTLLDVAIKSADLVCRTFGMGDDQIIGAPGHEEIEIGLVKLHRVTGDPKYLAQAKFFLDMRGRSDLREIKGTDTQDHLPVVEQSAAVGHAVRAEYLYSGMADVAELTGDAAYVDALERIWSNIVSGKTSLTGGVGARHRNETFGEPYELPNDTAYNETCAAIASVFFNHRMYMVHKDAKYVDVLERTLYNGLISGVSLSGTEFFYVNPLAWDGAIPFNHGNSSTRQPWFGCSCCPSNVVRFMPALPGYLYAQDDGGLTVNLFATSETTVDIGGVKVGIAQTTDYPWDGEVTIAIDPESPVAFTLRVRIPGWARNVPFPSDLYKYETESDAVAALTVNGERVALESDKGYAVLERTWNRGDVVKLSLPMPIRRVLSHGRVEANRGRAALERGPLVYCYEGSLVGRTLPKEEDLTPKWRDDLLGGVMTIVDNDGFEAIPYYAWGHRDPVPMAVWLPK